MGGGGAGGAWWKWCVLRTLGVVMANVPERPVVSTSPEGRLGTSDNSPCLESAGLSFNSTFLSALFLFSPVLLLFLSSPFSAFRPFSPVYFPEVSLSLFFFREFLILLSG